MELIRAQSIPEVWTKAVTYLEACDGHQDFDVILGITNSTALSKADLQVYRSVDRFLRDHGGSAVETVAETIFPMSDYLRAGAEGVYDKYPKRMNHIRARRTDRGWGTYALRMLEPRIDGKNRSYIPLKALVEKITNQGKYKASHELSLSPFESDIEMYDASSDRLRSYGGPCLSHLSFKVYDGMVRVNATYRSHYYIQRLLGNLVGLARLQVFIAKESALTPGPLTINSTYARLDTGAQNGEGRKWSDQDIAKLASECRKIYSGPKEADKKFTTKAGREPALAEVDMLDPSDA
jgi:hypothetical protein